MATIAKTTNPTKPWRVQIRRKGSPSQSKYFATNVDAKRWAREQETQVDHNPHIHTGAMLTLGALVETYIKTFVELPPDDPQAGKRDTVPLRSNLKHISEQLGQYRLPELTLEVLRRYAALPRRQSYRAKTHNPKPLAAKTLKSKLQLIKLVLRYTGVIAKAEAPSSAAIARVDTLMMELKRKNRLHVNKRDRRPELHELKTLEAYFALLPPNHNQRLPMWDMILFAMSTCMRRGEITKIVWEDFDPIDRTIWIMDRKDPTGAHSRNEEVPLLRGTFDWDGEPVDPIEVMNRQRTANQRAGRVFPYHTRWITRLFKQACDACGIEDLHFHDLRHEGVSLLFEDGRAIPEVSVVSGHRSWADLKRYTNLKPKNMHRQ